MPDRYVSVGGDSTRRDGVSLYKFPSNDKIRRQWIKQVQTYRANWEPSTR